MALRNGMAIHQYLYLDIDPTARKIAQNRIEQLRSLYPTLLSPAAVQGAFVSKSSLGVHIHAGDRQGSMMPGRFRLRDVSMPGIDDAWPMPGIDV
jgi:hypothetical protein